MSPRAFAWIMSSLGLVPACSAGDRPSLASTTPSVGNTANADDGDQLEVSGVVQAPDGTPAVNAVVALNGLKSEPLAVVRTDARGHFTAPRPRDPFAVTATSAQGTARFVAASDVPDSVVRIVLDPLERGLDVRGSLSMMSGRLPAGTFVLAVRVSEDEGDIFYAAVSEAGRFSLRLPPGTYWLRPNSEQLLARSVSASGSAGDHRDVEIEASERAPAPEVVVGWLRESAMPIATAQLQASTEDLALIAETLAKARVIGVGEATHGTHEYFRLKHRLLQRLVAHHGLALLAMEANFSDAERIDAWLQTGQGSVEEAMTGLFAVWRTEEVRDVLLWMRQWNADPKHRRKLRFRGYDVQGVGPSVAALRGYLGRVDPTVASSLVDPLVGLQATDDGGAISLDAAESAALRESIARLGQRLTNYRRRYVARSSPAEYELMLQHARVLEQARVRFAATGPAEQFAARDRAMADNVLWFADQLGEDERMMVWAHNGHIQLDASTLLGPNMGMALRERLGPDYVAAGFVLGEGSYRAWVKPNAPEVADVLVGPPQPGWVAEAFTRVGPPMFAVDLRTAPSGTVRDWLFAPHVLHSCGWLVSEREREGAIDSLGRLFDVAIYVGQTTSARQLPRRAVRR